MRQLICLCLLLSLPVLAKASPTLGDEVTGRADVGFELVVKKATLKAEGGYAVLGKMRLEGVSDAGTVVTGSGMVRIREFSGFDPARVRHLSGTGLLRYQGAVSEIYGDASYDLSLVGNLEVETVESTSLDDRVMSVKDAILVGTALFHQPRD